MTKVIQNDGHPKNNIGPIKNKFIEHGRAYVQLAAYSYAIIRTTMIIRIAL